MALFSRTSPGAARCGLVPLLLLSAACTQGGEVPTEAVVAETLRASREKPASVSFPRSTVEVHSVTLGKSDAPTEQQVVDGVPRDAWVTTALIDWTQRLHYTNATNARRMLTEAIAYKDAFGGWAVMTGGHRKDETTEEPPSP